MGAQADMLIPTTLKWRPLPVSLDAGVNHSTPTKIVIVDEENSYPCRKCLKDGKIGQRMLLLSYDPWLGDSPYRQPGPIYIHEQPKCDLIEFEDGTSAIMPEQQRRRLLSVRAFDKNHMMKGGDVFRGTDLLQKAEEFFKNDKIEYIHVHNAIPGCFAVRIDRGGATS
jgi:hypothetical protein